MVTKSNVLPKHKVWLSTQHFRHTRSTTAYGLGRMFMAMDLVNNFSLKAGYNGLSYTPPGFLRILFGEQRGDSGWVQRIGILRQSFRSEEFFPNPFKYLYKVFRHNHWKDVLAATMLLPERVASLRNIEDFVKRYQFGVGIPVEILPYHQWAGENQYALFDHFPYRVVTIAPALLGHWEIPATEFTTTAREKGYEVGLLDTKHFQEVADGSQAGVTTSFHPWRTAISSLQNFIAFVQLQPNAAELRDLMHFIGGSTATPETEILDILRALPTHRLTFIVALTNDVIDSSGLSGSELDIHRQLVGFLKKGVFTREE